MINKTISLCIHNRKCWNAQFGSVTSKTNLKCSFLGLWNQTLGFWNQNYHYCRGRPRT